MSGSSGFRCLVNPHAGVPGVTVLPEAGFRRARAAITGWEGYAPTPLRDVPALAAAAGVGLVRIKDESGRFGLGSFKALGGAYAVGLAVAAESDRRAVAPAALTVSCATDGNHGRAVAWGAAAGRLPLRDLRARDRQPGTGGRDRPLRRRGPPRPRHLRRCGPRRRGDGRRRGLDRRLRHLLARLHRDPPRGDAGLPADGRRGGRPMDRRGAHPRLHPGRRRRRRLCGFGAAARPVRSPAGAGGGGTRPRRLPARQRRGRAARRRGRCARYDHGRPRLRRAKPARLAGAGPCRRGVPFGPGRSRDRGDAGPGRRGGGIGRIGAAGAAGLLLAAADPSARAALGLGPESRVLLFSTEGATDPDLYRRLLAGAA